MKALLRQTNENIFVVVRANSEREGKDRLRTAMKTVEPFSQESLKIFDDRIVPVCGDLEKQRLGLDAKLWKFLTETIGTIYHNGAVVNYLYNYDKMRNSNVIGTNEVLRLALERRRKVFNHVSTTFIFGWAVKDTLFETDINNNLDLLDFGYSQTKFVSERIVKDAMSLGLEGRIFRPALITPSVGGGGYNYDISVRLLAFMINHGIGVDTFNQVSFTPADVAASNIIAISNLRDTVGKTFHVVRDEYYKMTDYTSEITRQIGQEFELFDLPRFVPEIINRCTENDLLFPLLDFMVRSEEKISSMEFKRYDSRNYQEARNRSEWGEEDPSLEDTVKGLLSFLQSNELIAHA